MHQAGQLVDCVSPGTFDSMIPKQPDPSTRPITITQAVQKMNGDRPTISALQKAGRLAEKRKTFATPQDDEDHEAFAADVEEQLRAEAAAVAGPSSSGRRPHEPTLFVEESEISGPDESEPIPLPSAPKRRGKGKGKGKGKEKEKGTGKKAVKTARKRVRFEFEEDEPEEEEEVEEEALPGLRRSRRVGRPSKKARGSKTTL
jgi:hypothetical protein